MDRLLSLTHLFDSYLSRIAGVSLGLALLWYGSSWISVGGLVMMLVGLVAVVSSAVPPRLSLLTPASPAFADVNLQSPHVQSSQ